MSVLKILSGLHEVALLDDVTIEVSKPDEGSGGVPVVTALDGSGNAVATMQLRDQEDGVYYGWRIGSAENMRWEVDGAPTGGGKS